MKVCDSCWLQTPDANAGTCTFCGGARLLPVEDVIGREKAQRVSNLTLEAGNGVVRGFWEFDGAEGRVRVFRRAGLPPGEYGGGDEVALLGPHSFEDRGVRNGRLYYYRVLVEYEGPGGKPLLTPGVCAAATPEAPPQAVERCELSFEQGVLHVTWKPPRLGAVRVYRTEKRPAWRVGEVLAAESLSSLGVVLKSSYDGLAVDYKPPEKTAFYVPVTIAGDRAVIGAPEFYVAAPEISKLSVRHHDSFIQLQWQWPPGCDLARVAWREVVCPQGPDDPLARIRNISRGEYRERGGLRIEDPPKERCYFVVYTLVKVDGQEFYSAGRGRGARYELHPRASLAVSYSISRGGWPRRRATITLTADKDVERLPEVVVVAGRGDIEPTSAASGAEVGRVKDVRLRANVPASFPFSAAALKGEPRLRAFFREPQPPGGLELRKAR
jgi:hypothetical protein